MNRVLGCMRCGHEGTDVSAALVDLEAEAKQEGARIREVEVVIEVEHRHITERFRHRVPERYGTEWRCRDKAACEARFLELARPVEEPAPVQDAPPWA